MKLFSSSDKSIDEYNSSNIGFSDKSNDLFFKFLIALILIVLLFFISFFDFGISCILLSFFSLVLLSLNLNFSFSTFGVYFIFGFGVLLL